jgi:hypothetical protein
MQFSDQGAPWKIANGAEKLLLQALNFNRRVFAANSRAGEA